MGEMTRRGRPATAGYIVVFEGEKPMGWSRADGKLCFATLGFPATLYPTKARAKGAVVRTLNVWNEALYWSQWQIVRVTHA